MNKEQAKYYLQSSGFSEEQVHTVIDALEMPYRKAFEDIRAEIEDGLNACVDIIDNTKKGVYPQIYSDDQMEGRKITYEHCLEIISKHKPDKAESEGEA